MKKSERLKMGREQSTVQRINLLLWMRKNLQQVTPACMLLRVVWLSLLQFFLMEHLIPFGNLLASLEG